MTMGMSAAQMGRRAVSGLLFGLLSLRLVAAEPEMRISPKGIRDEVRATIEAQIDALRGGRFEEAYALASRGIQARFDERLFAVLMRRGYAALLQAKEIDIGIVRDRQGEEAQVTVSVTDARGRPVVYRYWLVREPKGWRVSGVTAESVPARGDV